MGGICNGDKYPVLTLTLLQCAPVSWPGEFMISHDQQLYVAN